MSKFSGRDFGGAEECDIKWGVLVTIGGLVIGYSRCPDESENQQNMKNHK
jgi:hypothetical protein